MVESERHDLVRVAAGTVLAFVVSLAVVVGLGLALERQFVNNGPTSFDAHVTRWFVEHRSAGLTSLARAVTWLGSSAVVVSVAVVVTVVLVVRRRVRLTLYFDLAVAGAALLSALAKYMIGRDRPPERIRLAHVVSSAFPSGHSTQAAATWLALAVVTCILTSTTWVRIVAWCVAILVVALVGVSRVYLGVHWATDVIGGWVLGGLWVGGLTLAFAPLDREDLDGRESPTTCRKD